jgi:hypothetical protein
MFLENERIRSRIEKSVGFLSNRYMIFKREAKIIDNDYGKQKTMKEKHI